MREEFLVWPKYTNIIDGGSTVTLEMEYPNGQRKGVVLDKRFEGSLHDLTPKQYEAILFRNFNFSLSQSLVFTLSGGIGDFIIGFETILALREFLRRKSDERFEYVGLFDETRLQFFSRFLALSSVFDKATKISRAECLKTRFPQTRLDATPHDVRVEYYSFGSIWDVLWGKWGLPGHFPGILPRHYMKRITTSLDTEFSDNNGMPGFPSRKGYILLCPDAVGPKKMWPVDNWRLVLSELLKETSYDCVVLTSNTAQQQALALGERTTIYDYSDQSRDFLRFAALVHGARAVLTLDSAPAHVAGHLSKPCVVLWGPSNPTYYGHRNNINIRLSSCPPCFPRQRMQLCQDNVCIQSIRPREIVRYFKRLLNLSASQPQ